MENTRTTYIRKSTTFVLGQGQKDVTTPKGASETIPDQTMSLKQLVERHVKGLHVPAFQPTYNDEELPDIYKLDLVERQQLAEAARQNVKNITKELQSAKEKRERQEAPPVPPVPPAADQTH